MHFKGRVKMEPVIKFLGYSIDRLIYTKDQEGLEEEFKEHKDGKMGISLEYGVTEDLKNGTVGLSVRLIDDEKDMNISLKITGQFEINQIEDIDEIHQFLSVNGTAIIYPYVRSVISMVSSLDSEQAVVLPTINTTNFRNE